MIKKTLTILTKRQYTIQASYYFNAQSPSSTIIFYLHGGGLIFGQRDDLPEEYLNLLVNQGYSIVSLDYLLAPESNIDQILTLLKESVSHIIQESKNLLGQSNPIFVLMGRSAGSYLSLWLSKHLANKQIKGLILFYGYYNLNDANFLYPNHRFSHYPQVSELILKNLIQNGPITKEDQANRYLLYLDARQKGTWLDRLGISRSNIQDYSLSMEELTSMPPSLLIHSTMDPDVPYRQSVQMEQTIPNAQLITIEGNEHDFDRTNRQKGFVIYQQVANWLQELPKTIQ